MRIGSFIAGMLLSSLLRGGGRRGYGNMGGMGYYPRRRGGGLFSYLILGALAYFGYQHFSKQNQYPALANVPMIGRADRVIDGDTFYLGGQSIRIWGIDAPERDTKYYAASTQALQTILRGRVVTCKPVDRSHNRIVAQCSLGEKRDLGSILVRTGWAFDLPNKSGGAHKQLEKQAQQDGRGIWKG
jgi:endonuclease YncB( thermonuclease family)